MYNKLLPILQLIKVVKQSLAYNPWLLGLLTQLFPLPTTIEFYGNAISFVILPAHLNPLYLITVYVFQLFKFRIQLLKQITLGQILFIGNNIILISCVLKYPLALFNSNVSFTVLFQHLESKQLVLIGSNILTFEFMLEKLYVRTLLTVIEQYSANIYDDITYIQDNSQVIPNQYVLNDVQSNFVVTDSGWPEIQY
ncbi:Hypothetical_protein [Hexamita inflata]|uniref:Hypothetical_protein n=1 Tax=Hexamita inflata TaxID=28002 RepID=A0AA86TQH9_9EUKA|nr:Hypothetical protein HINF_LOCUS12240 [Hexamita inflata]CAI9937269.1 Hypothetical protein HINF_LOCUS24914 [Hexamita inflata]